VIARRKTPKDERELPPAARENPYALLSREEIAAALEEIDHALVKVSDDSETTPLLKKRHQIVEGDAWRMMREGLGTWNGGQPRGSKNPVKYSPGPYISDYVIEDRR
jgi:hypothetical protein